MSLPEKRAFELRRATTDDVPALNRLLELSGLPVASFEKRFTEFQLAIANRDELVGAAGLRHVGGQGLLHGEMFVDFGMADVVRPLLWERIKTVSKNHGLFCLWTRETAPFWKGVDFVPPSREQLERLPPEFAGDRDRGTWLRCQLRSEATSPASVDAQLAALKMEAEADRQRLIGHARLFTFLAYLLAIALFMFVMVGALYVLRPLLFRRIFGG